MKHFVGILFLSTSLISCFTDEYKEEKSSIKEPNKSAFNDEFFSENYYSYIKNQNGDSSRNDFTAYVKIKGKKVNYILRTSEATLNDGTLNLFLCDTPFSHSLFEMRIQYKNEFSNCIFSENKLKPNEKTIFETIEQEMTLDKLNYKVNDSLKGMMNIKVLANFDLGESSYIDTLFIKALVKTIVR